MGEPSIKTGKRGHDESVYGTVVEMIADFERQFLKKNKTIDYQGAMEYIAMKAGYDYLKIGDQSHRNSSGTSCLNCIGYCKKAH